MGNSLQHNTAILVFANSSWEESKRKPLVNGVGLFDTLTEKTLSVVSKTGIPYFHFCEKQQVGFTFGERFTNAIQAIFEKGYGQVITIGNDSPQLSVSGILEAKKQLKSKKFALGPSADGGFYLMGLHKTLFDPDTFRQLPWQTSTLAKQLLNSMHHLSIEVFQLPVLHDIDTERDVKLILAYAYRLGEKLLKALLSTIRSQKNGQRIFKVNFQSLVYGVQHNKGSPIFLYP